MEFSAQQIASLIQGTVVGDASVKVCNFSKIEEGKPGTLSFLANPKYEQYIYETNSSIVLVNNDFAPSAPIQATLIKVENAYASLAVLLKLVDQSKARKTGIATSASIESSAKIGLDTYIGNFAYIGANASIGDNCQIYPYAYIGDDVVIGNNVTIYPHVTIYQECIIGDRCIIHAGVVIGADGFGFAPEGDAYSKIPQLGHVILEDDVEIGANTCIDRAVMGATIIRKGVKLDNLVQIAHNVEVGENTVMASQAGISGSTKIGRNCMFGGQVGIAGHLNIGDRVTMGGQTGVLGNIKENEIIMGSPSMPMKPYMRSVAVFGKLPDIYRTIGKLEKEIEQLKKELIK